MHSDSYALALSRALTHGFRFGSLALSFLQETILDQISSGVAQLRDIALGFSSVWLAWICCVLTSSLDPLVVALCLHSQELKKQNILLDEISKKIDKSTQGVDELNKKTAKALKMVCHTFSFACL